MLQNGYKMTPAKPSMVFHKNKDVKIQTKLIIIPSYYQTLFLTEMERIKGEYFEKS